MQTLLLKFISGTLAGLLSLGALAQTVAPAKPRTVGMSAAMSAVLGAKEMLAQSRFDDLNALYDATRAGRERGVGDTFVLEWFYIAFASIPPAIGDERTLAWYRHSPKHPAAAISRARVLVEKAKAADKDNQWAQVDKLAAEALEILMAARAKGQGDSNWQSTRFGVARLQGWKVERIKVAVQEAVDNDPYPVIQYIAAASALAASGNKDPQLLRWLLDQVVRKTEKTEGQSMYARIPLEGAKTWFPSVWAEPLAAGNLEWPRLNQAMADWHARYPRASILAEHAALACIARDRPTARALLAKLEPRQDVSVFKQYGGPPLYERCKEWAG